MASAEHADVTKEAIQYTPRLVAFLDILGFKDLIRQAADRARAIDIVFHLEKSLLHARGSSAEVSVRMFSDCISMDAHADDPRILQKYGWMATYQDRPDRFQSPHGIRTRSF